MDAPSVKGRRFALALGQSGGEDTHFFSHLHAAGGRIVFAEDAMLSEPVPENRASFLWLAKRRFRSGQTHGRLLADRKPGIRRVGQVLKARKPSVKMIAVEPEASPVLSGGEPGPHKIQGIGAGFILANVDRSVIDGVEKVSNDEAFEMARKVARVEGIPVGISSGAALVAAYRQAALAENKGKTIVAIIPSFAERYLSTALFEGL